MDFCLFQEISTKTASKKIIYKIIIYGQMFCETKTSGQYELKECSRNSYSTKEKTQNTEWIKTGIISLMTFL